MLMIRVRMNAMGYGNFSVLRNSTDLAMYGYITVSLSMNGTTFR